MLHTGWAFILVLLILAGCQLPNNTEPIACRDFVDPRLLSFAWETVTDVAGDWVSTDFPDATKIQEQISPDYIAVHWMIDDRSYVLWFEDRVHLLSQQLLPQPTIGDLLRCYGEPEYYATEYAQAPEAAAIRLTIWYPELGLTFESAEYTSWRFMLKTRFDRWTRLYSATLVEPGTIEEVLKRGTAYDEIVNETLGMIQPWPKDFQVIEHELQ